MQNKRREEREKRARNRIVIAYTLVAILVIIMVVGYFITDKIILAAGFILPLAIAYFIAGWWEKRELDE